ncbi:class III extradiol ring-cleavage dioxygenase [Actinomycetospora corticicola]|jgi:4,5-DOPA dioxygenase extradiol|uniref:4,5-DOPA dioxygenase extradiol n=1 Tax=Actinomycetospora corticicola TaxID=663602 RepID=A0A7Y9E1N1_9PSEU|nr:class III extradiol ring-cleavage dioxygenase [Actinomycetospora corticicola]NYD39405.1 4,5-DOPA dioxygenase extradiol [Actinomycetospora corticicola]
MSSPFDTAAPGAAFDAFIGPARDTASGRRPWTPADGPMPAIYLSHGAPPLYDDGGWMRDLFGWAHRMPQPRAIVIVSAHWESAPLTLSAPDEGTPLVYDFGGFAPRYYTMTYATPDATALSDRVAGLLGNGTEEVHRSARGLDHGAWVPLSVMYPNADVPVLQVSMPDEDPERLMRIGARLRELRHEGVLVVGSGFMTHGLPFLTRDMLRGDAVPGWTDDFDAWVSDALARGDVEELRRFRDAPGMPYAHPTAEHYVPLFVALGAATDPEAPVRTEIDGMMWGLSRRSFSLA